MDIPELFPHLLRSRDRAASCRVESDRPAAAQWHRLRNPWTMMWRGACHELVKKLPPCRFKNAIYRMMGVRIGKNVVIFPNADLSAWLGELVTLEDNVVIGFGAALAVDALTQDSAKLGKIHVKKGAVVGGRSFVGPGVTIGERAIVANCACVTKDVPDGDVVGGVPAKSLRKPLEKGP